LNDSECGSSIAGCTCELSDLVCNNSSRAPFTVLEAGQEFSNQFVSRGNRQYYRFYHPDADIGFRIEVRIKYGDISLYASTTVPEPTRFTASLTFIQPSGPVRRLVCPVFDGFQTGTWFITVEGRVDTSYSIFIRSVEPLNEDKT